VEVLGAFALTRKEAITDVIFARLSEGISAAPVGRISMKFYIGDFYENLSINTKFG
jgi:hypothetical protein